MQQARALLDLEGHIRGLQEDRDALQLEATEQTSSVKALEHSVLSLQGQLQESATALAKEGSMRQEREEKLAALQAAMEALKHCHM
jgi:hypothetical protein